MKKLFSLSDNVAQRLEQIAKEQKTSQSKLVETAIVIYLMIQYGAPEQAIKLNDLIPKNQIDIFDIIKKP